MRKFLVSVALATAAVGVTVPAAAQAQPYARSPYRPLIVSRVEVNDLIRNLNRAENRIERSLRRGFISPREAFGLRREARAIHVQLNRAARNGIGGREFASLRFQVNRLEQRIQMERRDWDRRRG